MRLLCKQKPTRALLALEKQITYHAATLVGHEIFVFGGYEDRENRHLYVLNIQTDVWEEHLVPFGIAANRYGHTADLCGDKLYFIGGYNDSRYRTEELTLFDLVQREWIEPATYGKAPEYIFSHSSGFLPANDTIVLLLKNLQIRATGMLYSLHIDTLTWKPLRAKGRAPESRSRHACCSGKDKLYFFGGLDGNSVILDDLFILSYAKEQYLWTWPSTRGTFPPSLFGATLTNVCGKMFLFGGQGLSSSTNHLYIYDPEQNTWTDAWMTGEVPGPRAAHRCVQSPRGILVLGGTYDSLASYYHICYDDEEP